MFISNLILVNILIAIFTDTYKNINRNIRRVWTNGRYEVILEDYHYMPYGPAIGGIVQLLLIFWFIGCSVVRIPAYIQLKWVCWTSSQAIKTPIFFNKVISLNLGHNFNFLTTIFDFFWPNFDQNFRFFDQSGRFPLKNGVKIILLSFQSKPYREIMLEVLLALLGVLMPP